MTDLTGKFADLKTALEEDHLDVMARLGEILAALGATPPEDATRQDIVDVLGLIHGGIQNLGINQQTTNARLSTISTGISSLIALQSTGNSTLASMLNFFVNNDWCCNSTPPWEVTPPPLHTNPSLQDAERCKRAQRAVDLAVMVLDKIDVLLSQAGPTTNTEIYNAYNTTAELVGGYAPSGPELSNMAYAVNNARMAGISNLGGLLFSFKSQLADLLFSAENPVEARQSIISWTQTSFGDPFTREIMAFVIHNRLLNAVYDDGDRTIDTTGYNGSLCSVVIGQCMSVSSSPVTCSPSFGHSPRQQAVFISMGPLLSVIESAPGLVVTYGEPVIMTSGFQGGRIYYKQGRVRVVYGVPGVSSWEFPLTQPGNWVNIPLDAEFLILDDSMYPSTTGSGAFEVTFCTGEGV